MMEPNRNGAGKVEILLVEDNQSDASSILNVLQKANICNKVHVLEDGGAILDFVLRRGPYSAQGPIPAETLILLSLNLRGMHGLDALRRLKSDERSKNYPIIMMTSSQEERGVMQSYKLGASGCIVKPFDLQKFIEAVAELRLGWLLLQSDAGSPK